MPPTYYTFRSRNTIVKPMWRSWDCIASTVEGLYEKLLLKYGRTEEQAKAMGLQVCMVYSTDIPEGYGC